jgi:hypothetical protein
VQLSEVSEACNVVTNIELELRLVVLLALADVDIGVRGEVAPKCDRQSRFKELT